jgi:hypothetical protein
MGVDPLTIGLGLSAGSSLLGAFTQNKANNQNYNAQQQAAAAQAMRQQQITDSIMPYLNSGPNQYSAQLMNMLGGGFAAPQALSSPSYSAASYSPTSYSAGGYNPAMLGSLGQMQGLTMDPTMLNTNLIPRVGASGVNGTGVNASQIPAPQIDLSSVTGSRGFNSGQDGLLQMMNRNYGPTQDPGLTAGLSGAGANFNNSDLFSALAPLDQKMIDQQVAQLQGSSGSLGQRFGTATADREALMRGTFAQNVTARNAQLQSSSFEAAQNRMLQGLGIQAQRESAMNQFGLQGAQLQQSAAQAAQSGGLQQAGLLGQLLQANQSAGLQASLANQNTGLQAQTTTAQQMLQAALANQSTGMQSQQLNQQSMLQALLANQQAGQQAGLANQSAGMQSQQFNLGNMLQMMLANQGSQNAAGQFLAGAQNQAGQYNAGAANAAGQFNAGSLNQAGQFNAGMQSSTNQFNAGQNQMWNQFQAGIIGQAAGYQQQQQALNAQLLSIMAGMPMAGVPQAPSSPYPDALSNIGQMMMFLPFLKGMMGKQGESTGGSDPFYISR